MVPSVTLIEAEPINPALFAAVRVMMSIPQPIPLVMVSPLPITPDRSEIQTKESPVRGPSTPSMAVPLNVTVPVGIWSPSA